MAVDSPLALPEQPPHSQVLGGNGAAAVHVWVVSAVEAVVAVGTVAAVGGWVVAAVGGWVVVVSVGIFPEHELRLHVQHAQWVEVVMVIERVVGFVLGTDVLRPVNAFCPPHLNSTEPLIAHH